MLVPKRSVRLLSASALFLFSMVYAVSGFAYPIQTVQSGQWTQVSIPADPGSSGTVENLFGDDLPPAQYGASGSWLIYRFDSALYEYRLVELNERLQANTGYWLFQRVGQAVELDIPDSLSPLNGTITTGCIQGRQCATIPLTGSSNSGIWNMVGYSSDSQTSFGDTRIVTASGACADGCTPAQARAANVIYDVMYTLNDASTAYEVITESSAMQPWDGYWLLVLADADQPRWVVPVSTGSDPQPPGGTNQSPVAVNDTFGPVTAAGTSVFNVTANDSDPDGSIVPATVSIVDNPSAGFVFVTNNGSVRYTHNGSAGTTSDSFTYTVADNSGAVSNVATVTISSIDYPQQQNRAPVAVNDTVGPGTIGGTLTFSVTANDSDPDGSVDQSSVAIVTAPSAGTASVTSNGQIRYTHNGNTGALSDSLAYRVADNDGAFSNSATVSISISGSSSGNVPLETPANGVGEDAFVNFESGHVRPIALSDDGNRLYVVNTPNSTLEIFNVNGAGLTFAHSVPVGLEPVAVSLRGSEAWVVNHLSDSVSIVDVSAFTPYVSKTLLVGDEPRDVVFAGQNNQFAFVTAAARGQNGPDDNPIDARLFTPGVGRANVWVFDADATGNSLGGDPIDVVNLFGDVPRALAVSEDGSSVYAAILHSGNQTTTIAEADFAKHGPTTSADGVEQPDTSIIVKFNGTDWVDERGSTSDLQGTEYNDFVPFTLPDYDVFEIAADRNPRVTRRISGVGTTLFNMTVDPASGDVFVTNTEALNVNRFEGEAELASVPTETLRGNFIQSRISIIDNLSNVTVRDLNSQLDFDRPATAQEKATAVTQPLGMALTGNTLYVTAFASRSVARYDINQLRNDTFTNTTSSQASLSGGGPTGLVVDGARNRLYVVTRFNNSVAIVDAQSMTETSSVQLYNPEPAIIKTGREFLYDASRASSHGTGSCGACHIFGDTDHLAWNLGNPDGRVEDNPLQFASPIVAVANPTFHPLKGPMATQSLRGLPNTGALHWRGDRTGLNGEPGESQERAAFREFNVTFPDLLGAESEISDANMGRFADFTLTMQYPPNPIRRLDNSLTPAQQRGRDDYLGIGNNANVFGVPFRVPSTAVVLECQSCHTLDPDQGFFGTSGLVSFEGAAVSQEFKVPHLRNAYTKVGRFGAISDVVQNAEFGGDQIRGYGFLHDGAIDTLDHFFRSNVFTGIFTNTSRRTDIIEFVMAMDSNYDPVVGQQVTLSSETGADTDNRLNLLQARASLSDPECDLIAKGVVDGEPRGYLLTGSSFRSDTGQTISSSALRSQVKSSDDPMTFTCVPPGSGRWMGIDRNNDGALDGQ